MSFKFKKSAQTSSFQNSVWLEFSPLSLKYKAINLGQGFPDFEPPKFVTDAQIDAIERGGFNQYARSAGHMRLVNVLSKMYSPLFKREISPTTEIVTTVGASEAIFTAIQSIVSPGDEVIVIQPYFDIYLGAILMAGGIPKYVSLKEQPDNGKGGNPRTAENWKLDISELEAAITSKTKCLILNNPHNPVGKVYTREELSQIANAVKKSDQLVVISDEVYEWLTFDGAEHIRFATLPDMYERTVTVSSSGKSFSATGWKIGWCIGPTDIIGSIIITHQYVPFSVSTLHQEAIAVALETAQTNNYFSELKSMYQKKRDYLLKSLTNNGFNPVVPQGTYFIMGDISSIKLKGDEGKNTSITGMGLDQNDWNVARWLTTDIGVASIPLSAFYTTDPPSNFSRFCFCKKEEVLEQANERFKKLQESKKFTKDQ